MAVKKLDTTSLANETNSEYEAKQSIQSMLDYSLDRVIEESNKIKASIESESDIMSKCWLEQKADILDRCHKYKVVDVKAMHFIWMALGVVNIQEEAFKLEIISGSFPFYPVFQYEAEDLSNVSKTAVLTYEILQGEDDLAIYDWFTSHNTLLGFTPADWLNTPKYRTDILEAARYFVSASNAVSMEC
ncbi:hypothetical protein FCL40_18140 [Ferrimonas sediminicola]|uniref:Uncharacterized protein n=1 Tax=Ferrimonas sediminicola TaxID=2569538 RepID=A0A4U1B6Y0_9GAMM|nr:hypothetical protein [Ferrimonas sediminicola]TKB46215.1 hypothetical protein FCL40_18140 [Ferrimonas sediminicola]